LRFLTSFWADLDKGIISLNRLQNTETQSPWNSQFRRGSFVCLVPIKFFMVTRNKGICYYIPGGERILNMGLGVILIFVAIIFILWGLFSGKQKNRIISSALLVVGTIALFTSILLLTGIYDPYANHIK